MELFHALQMFLLRKCYFAPDFNKELTQTARLESTVIKLGVFFGQLRRKKAKHLRSKCRFCL